MARTLALCVSAVVLGAAGNAHALKPGSHADIAKASCLGAELPADFCTRVATEDYDTDSREWDDLRAHAQIDDGETACGAADRAAARLFGLGGDLRAALAATRRSGSESDVGHVGAAVGRALHTIQDNCAHHGMPNPQHVWFSLGDFCDGTNTSPDTQDDALVCARAETDAMFVAIADAIRTAGVARTLDVHSCPPQPHSPHDNGGPPAICQARFLPGPIDACSFLGRAKDWDGIDRTWENRVATPSLRHAFEAGLAGESVAPSICGGDETVLSSGRSEPMVDVSVGPASCVRASLFCLGKADDSENPFADETSADDTGGCHVGQGGSATWLVAMGGALLLMRRRRS